MHGRVRWLFGWHIVLYIRARKYYILWEHLPFDDVKVTEEWPAKTGGDVIRDISIWEKAEA